MSCHVLLTTGLLGEGRLYFQITCLSCDVWLCHGGLRGGWGTLQNIGPKTCGDGVGSSQGRVFAQVVDESKSKIYFQSLLIGNHFDEDV